MSKFVEWRDATILQQNEPRTAPSTLGQEDANTKDARNVHRVEHVFASLTVVGVAVCTPAVKKALEISSSVHLMEAAVDAMSRAVTNSPSVGGTNAQHMAVENAVKLMAAAKAHNQVHAFVFVMEVEENAKLNIAKRSQEGKVGFACLMQQNYKINEIRAILIIFFN